MTPAPRSERAELPWSTTVIALVAIVGHIALLTDRPAGAWILPVCVFAAALAARPRLPDFGSRWTALIIAFAAAAISVGALATDDLSWDGFSTWSLNARALHTGEGLNHPYFANPNVYHFLRDYPLLQPLLLQQLAAWLGERGARLLFPLLWLLWIGAVARPLRDLGVRASLRAMTVAGAALVPIFFDPGHGGADSGFADLLVSLLLAQAAGALVTRNPWSLALATLLLPLAKQEGTAYAVVAIVVAGLTGRPRPAIAAALGAVAGLALWIPLQHRLAAPNATIDPSWVPLAFPVVACCLGLGLRHRGWAFALVLALLALGGLLAQSDAESPWLRQLANTLNAVRPNWAGLDDVALGFGISFLWVKKFGLTFPLMVAAIWCAVRRRELGVAAAPLAMLLACLGLIAVFLLSRPPDELPLYISEGLPRYMAHGIGVAWIALGCMLWGLDSRDASRSEQPA